MLQSHLQAWRNKTLNMHFRLPSFWRAFGRFLDCCCMEISCKFLAQRQRCDWLNPRVAKLISAEEILDKNKLSILTRERKNEARCKFLWRQSYRLSIGKEIRPRTTGPNRNKLNTRNPCFLQNQCTHSLLQIRLYLFFATRSLRWYRRLVHKWNMMFPKICQTDSPIRLKL